MTTIKQAIMSGPNRWVRILGHGTIHGLQVRLRIRVAVLEYTDATRENDAWHKLGGNWPLSIPFVALLQNMPLVARFELTPALANSFSDEVTA